MDLCFSKGRSAALLIMSSDFDVEMYVDVHNPISFNNAVMIDTTELWISLKSDFMLFSFFFFFFFVVLQVLHWQPEWSS